MCRGGAIGLGLLFVVVAAWPSCIRAGAPAPRPVTDKVQVTHLIAQLGSPLWLVREDAQKQLISLGWGILPTLRAARHNDDPEVAMRLNRAIAEIEKHLEARRTELRGKMGEGYFNVSKANYLALLALPDPPLRDCYPATYVFRQQKDWPALATALEAAGTTLQRVMAAPVQQFVKATADRPPPNGIRQVPQSWQTHGSYVYVQERFDGCWGLRQGTVKDWLPQLRKAQQSLRRDCAGVYWELGTLYRDKLHEPKDALRAVQLAVAQQPFCAEPLDTLVPKLWPKARIGKDVLWPNSARMGASRTAWSTRDALTDLAHLQEQTGAIPGALRTRIRIMLAVRLLNGTWDNYRREPEKVWSLVRRLSANAALPPLPWFNVLSPARPTIRFDLDAAAAPSAQAAPVALNVVAAPGERFAKIQFTADLQSQGERGEFECYYFAGRSHTTLGWVQWHVDKRPGREKRTTTFAVPPDAEVLHFGVFGHVQVHSAVVTATFAAPSRR